MALVDQQLEIICLDNQLKNKLIRSVEALACYFLAHLIDLAKNWVFENWKKDIGQNEVKFAANIGMPVEYLDDLSFEKIFKCF